MYWIAPLVVFLFALVYRFNRGAKIHRNGEKLTRPLDTLPLLGNAIKFLQPRQVLFDWFVECQRHCGRETFEISVPTLPPGVVINDPKNLEFVLKNEQTITKGQFFKKRSWDLFGYGIINANGELWKAQRKAGLKFFSGTNLEVLIEEVLPEIYVQTRLELVSYADAGAEFDLQTVFLDLTTKVMGQMAYDASIYAPDRPLHAYKQPQMDISASSPFSKAFDHASDHIGLRFQNPLYFLTELFTGSKFRASLAEVKKFGKQIVRDSKKRRSQAAFESLITSDDVVLGTLIDSLIETFSSPAIVADAALNFLSAGRDTTAQSLTWMFYMLMRHPESIDFVRGETSPLFSAIAEENGKSQSLLTVSQLQPSCLPRTTALFYETLRLRPPVPFEIKECEAPITLPDGTFLPTGALVIWCIWAMNRSPQTFGDDAEIFRPGRWLDESGRLISKTAFEFPVFNGGPRACLGKKMAELMAAWVVVKMLGEFEFEEVRDAVDRGKERESQNSLTLPMKNGLPCRVRIRI